MEHWHIITTALIPVVVLIGYICWQDKLSPEPAGQLLKAFFFGLLSVFVSFGISIPLSRIGAFPAEMHGAGDAIRTAFFGAAIPEEIAKFAMLWLAVRRNPHFDEKMDGIVYAVFVSLGFAGFENLCYLFENADAFLAVGISRGVFSIPGHFGFGVLMGYYYSLAKFYPQSRRRNRVLILVAPILAHGIFDGLLMLSDFAPAIDTLLLLTFCFFCYKLWQRSRRSIREHLLRDGIVSEE